MSSMFTVRKSTAYLVVHCSATQPKMDIGAKEIRQWHREKGWIDIGYHFVIRRDGKVEIGRPENVVGAHVENHNSNSIGICLVGGVDANLKPENNFTPAQFAALALKLHELKQKYPNVTVQGHRDFPGVKKDCPSFDTRKWIKDTGVFTETAEPIKLDNDGLIIRCIEVTAANPTLFSLAKRFGYTAAELQKANPFVDPTQLKVGQLIRLPD
ncbi:LysM domain-containing protein [Rhizobium mongolense subsp. loessense]|uniref:LysM domain-containing protein n=1 Tax=Rhizobium mongolense subsp. loessense TaxID=158890 RepID=A0A1G4T6V2_9HYPH|nr:N-acetylmuramoyl-L-alanine amidase [Rhizobium mongolense]SCW77184.1 LysM domain-containing protein [Rhizobium mongolense subsp. loessense]